MKTYIAIEYDNGNQLDIVQWAHSVEQAKAMIENNIMPPLKTGYHYKIIQQ